jgi:cellulose 1,4-beta-cellobiosidase
MVLVMSLWDDAEANMLWLDADYPTSRSPTVPGVNRGPCNQDTGRPSFLRAKFPDARVRWLRWGLPVGDGLNPVVRWFLWYGWGIAA